MDKNSIITFSARYFDGLIALGKKVEVELYQDNLSFEGQLWYYSELRAIVSAPPGELHVNNNYENDEYLAISDTAAIEWLKKSSSLSRSTDPKRLLMLRKAVLSFIVAIVAILLLYFSYVPSLANYLTKYISVEAEIELGEKIQAGLLSYLEGSSQGATICSGVEGQGIIDDLADRLYAVDRGVLPLKVIFIDSRVDNAFALPGGRIIITSSLVESMPTSEAFATVLAHEIGHVVYRDNMREVMHAAGTAGMLSLIFGDFVGGTFSAVFVEAIITANHSREVERRADIEAVKRMHAVHAPSESVGEWFLSLKHDLDDEMDNTYASQTDPDFFDLWLSSHPYHDERARMFREADAQSGIEFKPIMSNEKWEAIRNMCSDTSPAEK